MTAAEAASANLMAYDCIGLASGIYFQKFHADILDWAEKMLPAGKKVFLLYTCGSKQGRYTDAIRRIVESKGARLVGSYGCRGFDTFGPFKLVGGIAKGHPDEREIAGAAEFYRRLDNSGGETRNF